MLRVTSSAQGKDKERSWILVKLNIVLVSTVVELSVMHCRRR